MWRKGWMGTDGERVGTLWQLAISHLRPLVFRLACARIARAHARPASAIVLCNPCGLLYSRGWCCSWCNAVYRKTERRGVAADANHWLPCDFCNRWEHLECEITHAAAVRRALHHLASCIAAAGADPLLSLARRARGC